MNTDKKFGGTIENWTLNKLTITKEKLKELRPDIVVDEAMILSGYVVEDPLGRWQPGFHMRSSIIIDIDRENGIIETENTIYHVQGEEKPENDMGDSILRVFY